MLPNCQNTVIIYRLPRSLVRYWESDFSMVKILPEACSFGEKSWDFGHMLYIHSMAQILLCGCYLDNIKQLHNPEMFLSMFLSSVHLVLCPQMFLPLFFIKKYKDDS